MGGKPSSCVAEHTCQVEGIPITIKCIQDGTGISSCGYHQLVAYNSPYGLNYRSALKPSEGDNAAVWNKIVESVNNKTCTAKFMAGSLDLSIPNYHNPIVIFGMNKNRENDPSHNAAILTCYRTQQRKYNS